MQINSKQLTHYLQQSLSPIYLISGDEPLLVQQACDAVRAAAQKAGYLNKQRFYIEANFDWSMLANQLNTLSLFSQQRFIELHLEHLKLSETSSKIVQNIALDPPSDTILLIKTAKLTAPTKATAWYKAIEKKALCLSLWPLNQQELRNWIKQGLHQAQLQADTEIIELIASACEGNLLAAQQSIQKLQLIFTSGKLSYTEVVAAITDHAHFSIFDLGDAILAGKAEQVVRIIEVLKAEGVEPILVLWAITKELRQLIKISAERTDTNTDALLQKFYIREAQKPLLKKCLQRHNQQTLQALLQQGLLIDQAIKGVKKERIWDSLLQLSLALSGVEVIKPSSKP